MLLAGASWALIAGAVDLARADERGAPPEPGEAPPAASAAAAPSAWRPRLRGAEEVDEVARYSLDARLDAVEHRVDGEGTITLRNTSEAPLEEIWLHLYLNGFKNERSAFMRDDVGSGFRGGGRPERWGWMQIDRLVARELDADLLPLARPSAADPEDETDLRVSLPQQLAPGQELTLEIRWRSMLPGLVHRTGFFGSFHMVGQWFPKLARLLPDGSWAHFPFHQLSEFYADFGSYDVRVDVPEGYVVGATGEPREEHEEDGRVIRRFVARGVHDFAFTAWDGFAERTAEGPGGVTIRCLYPPSLDDLAQREIDAASWGLGHYADAYGAYPYRTLTVVHPPVGAEPAGGMEYPTLITTGGRWYEPLIGLRSVEGVTLHELGHQWFYGLVASDEHAWPFLDEGITSWATARAMEERWGAASGYAGLGWTISHAAWQRAAAASVSGFDVVGQPAPAFVSGRDYGRLVYSRTATLLETLRRVYGRERLEAAVGSYARAARFSHPGPDQLVEAVRAEVGEEAADLLHRGLFERSWVDFQVTSVQSEPSRAAEGIFGDPDKPRPAAAAPAAAHLGSVLVRRLGDLAFPVEIELWSADGSVRRVTWDGQRRHERIGYEGDSPLVAAVIDPDQRVLLDQDLSNNVRRLDRQRLAPRVWTRASTVAQLLMGVLAP